MNKVILMGRLTRNPDVRYSQGEKATCVARYTLAVNRRFRREGDQDADFINCVAFGRQGEFAEKYLKQGTKIVISGYWLFNCIRSFHSGAGAQDFTVIVFSSASYVLTL
mgnify:CR=1 FL=1